MVNSKKRTAPKSVENTRATKRSRLTEPIPGSEPKSGRKKLLASTAATAESSRLERLPERPPHRCVNCASGVIKWRVATEGVDEGRATRAQPETERSSRPSRSSNSPDKQNLASPPSSPLANEKDVSAASRSLVAEVAGDVPSKHTLGKRHDGTSRPSDCPSTARSRTARNSSSLAPKSVKNTRATKTPRLAEPIPEPASHRGAAPSTASTAQKRSKSVETIDDQPEYVTYRVKDFVSKLTKWEVVLERAEREQAQRAQDAQRNSRSSDSHDGQNTASSSTSFANEQDISATSQSLVVEDTGGAASKHTPRNQHDGTPRPSDSPSTARSRPARDSSSTSHTVNLAPALAKPDTVTSSPSAMPPPPPSTHHLLLHPETSRLPPRLARKAASSHRPLGPSTSCTATSSTSSSASHLAESALPTPATVRGPPARSPQAVRKSKTPKSKKRAVPAERIVAASGGDGSLSSLSLHALNMRTTFCEININSRKERLERLGRNVEEDQKYRKLMDELHELNVISDLRQKEYWQEVELEREDFIRSLFVSLSK